MATVDGIKGEPHSIDVREEASYRVLVIIGIHPRQCAPLNPALTSEDRRAIRTTGELASWDQTTASRSVPLGSFADVAVNEAHDCAIRGDGTLVFWDETGETSAPEGVFTDVTVSADVSCGIRDDQTVLFWSGELEGATAASRAPTWW
ncbi:MAG: hypothetical protein JW751_02740 [Polyangiaceae bacterium]|nr:hypothetical protein [Polyangiaceae bacterium]